MRHWRDSFPQADLTLESGVVPCMTRMSCTDRAVQLLLMPLILILVLWVSACSPGTTRFEDMLETYEDTGGSSESGVESPDDKRGTSDVRTASDLSENSRCGSNAGCEASFDSAPVVLVSSERQLTSGVGLVVRLTRHATLEEIAEIYSIPVEDIKEVNGLTSNSLLPDQHIILPIYHRGVNDRLLGLLSEKTKRVEYRKRPPSSSEEVSESSRSLRQPRIKYPPVAKRRFISHTVSKKGFLSYRPKLKPKDRERRRSGEESVRGEEKRVVSDEISVIARKAVSVSKPHASSKDKKLQKEESTEQHEYSTEGIRFRWPVVGRVISNFGSKKGDQVNEGMNFAVPRGTVIVAIEAGEVIYAGEELEDYGKLVLIRHAGNWVSGYSHLQDILVTRGSHVLRSQVIAHSGSSGKVIRPQLHFELRKGFEAVDPRIYIKSLIGKQ